MRICLIVGMGLLTGLPQKAWKYVAENYEPPQHIPYAEAEQLFHGYRQEYDSLVAVLHQKIEDENLTRDEDIRISKRIDKMRRDSRLAVHRPGWSNFFKHPVGVFEYRRREARKPGSEFWQTHAEILSCSGFTDYHGPDEEEQARNSYLLLVVLPLWLLRMYLLWMPFVALLSLLRVWRDPKEERVLDPRRWGSFLLRLPRYPWYWLKHALGEAVVRQYLKKGQALESLTPEDKVLVQRFVKGFLKIRSLRQIKRQQGFRRQRSLGVALGCTLLLICLPRIVISQNLVLQGDASHVVLSQGGEHCDNGPPTIVKAHEQTMTHAWLASTLDIFEIIVRRLWPPLFAEILAPQDFVRDLGPPPEYCEYF